MHTVSSRPATPSRSPHHSRPVPIPHSPTTELPPANALRYKHLYGYTQASASTSFASSSAQESSTDSSEGDYEDFLVDTREIGIVIDERDRASISSDFAGPSSMETTSTAPPIFPISRVTTAACVDSIPDETVMENAEQAYGSEEGTQTPLATSRRPPSDSLPLQETPSPGDEYFPIGASDGTIYNSINVPATRVNQMSRTRQRSTTTSPRAIAKSKAIENLDEEFRCQTCYHAGLCAELVMKDPNFRCGDIDIAGSTSKDPSGDSTPIRSGVGGKTPWTKQVLDGMNLGSQIGSDDGPGKPKLRVLDGGVDYVQYDEAEGRSYPGRDNGVADMEDLGHGLQAVSIAYRKGFHPVSTTATTSSASESTETSSSHTIGRPFRQTWTDIKVDYPVSTSSTSDDSTSESSSTSGILPTCADARVHLGPILEKTNETSTNTKSMLAEKADRSRMNSSKERGRSRSRNNPFWTLHNLTAGLLSGGTLSGDGVDGGFDYDDRLYGVDVVERGRSRTR